jgi:hypothetical protein
VSRGGRIALLVGLVAVLAAAAVTCAQGVGRVSDDGGGSSDSVVAPDVGGGDDGGVVDADVIEDGSVQSDGAVVVDGGPACDPDPLPETAGAQCQSAIDVGGLSDSAADLVTVTGNGVPAGREIWWTFVATDDLDTAGDEFHVDVRFINNPGSGYQMDVFRGSCDPDDQLATSETFAFDWYTDFNTTSTGCTTMAPCGEGDCVASPGAEGVNTCSDDTSVFYVRVTRVDAASSCDGFHLELSNGFYSAP